MTVANGAFLISDTALRHSRALRLKAAPGIHSLELYELSLCGKSMKTYGTYFTDGADEYMNFAAVEKEEETDKLEVNRPGMLLGLRLWPSLQELSRQLRYNDPLWD